MEPQHAGLGIVDQAGGIICAHLEKYAHFEFANCLPAETASQVVVGIARRDDMETEAGAFAYELVEHRGRLDLRFGVARGKTEVLLITETAELLEPINEEKDRRSGVRIRG